MNLDFSISCGRQIFRIANRLLLLYAMKASRYAVHPMARSSTQSGLNSSALRLLIIGQLNSVLRKLITSYGHYGAVAEEQPLYLEYPYAERIEPNFLYALIL
jgi:hypothetical protein